MVAAGIARLQLSANSPGNVSIEPDLNSFTSENGSSGAGGGFNGNGFLGGPSPTTAVAMIILYSITGIITTLFVIIIITGALRAHRHPERYGPRASAAGRAGQSRAKGIARAMLATLPIVKFGDQDETPPKPPAADRDLEMNPPGAPKPTKPTSPRALPLLLKSQLQQEANLPPRDACNLPMMTKYRKPHPKTRK